jgi:cysteine desulfurase
MAVYLDYNATAPIRPEAREAAICALDIGGNPSSVHANGRLARAAVEQARGEVATLVGANAEQVTFTSGGTEANALAVTSAIAAGAKRPIVLMTEHDSTLNTATASGLWTEAWPVSSNGVASLDWLRDRLKTWRKEDGAPFAALSLANHETGVIQPVAEAAEIIHEAGGWLHVDAVQAAGKIAVDFNALGADTLSLSGHKLGAPQGVGALIAGPRAKLQRRQFGGGQERGLRAGTENLSGIAGFGAAASAALRDLPFAEAQASWRDAAAERLKDAGCIVAGEAAPRLPGTLCIVAEGWESQLQVMALDLAGVMVSAGSACSSGKVTPSHVLAAMKLAGLTENFARLVHVATAIDASGLLANYGLRASGGWATTEDDWTQFADAWLNAHARHSNRRKVA